MAEHVVGSRIITCRFCGRELKAMNSRYGYWFKCDPCNASVGCHKGTDFPLGTMAKPYLRRKRNEAHAAFDPLFKLGLMKRRAAYKRLADALEIAVKDCHIAWFEAETCEKVVAICDRWKREYKPTNSRGS